MGIAYSGEILQVPEMYFSESHEGHKEGEGNLSKDLITERNNRHFSLTYYHFSHCMPTTSYFTDSGSTPQ